VDGSHIFENVFVDFFYSCRLLASNGLILFDDCTDKRARKVIHFIDKNYSSLMQRENLSAIVNKSIMRRAANALGFRQLVAYRKIGDCLVNRTNSLIFEIVSNCMHLNWGVERVIKKLDPPRKGTAPRIH
jgi:hypothetical protein